MVIPMKKVMQTSRRDHVNDLLRDNAHINYGTFSIGHSSVEKGRRWYSILRYGSFRGDKGWSSISELDSFRA